ncbi:beta-glucoside-specific PTS transporter subunit IIABC [Xylocopilactobacillus apicola]|uniref:PTS system sucrose-specific EIIBCA component n=1 Tax=Xylocopilactobacillus apicola TaxID=2932184 RepID=A0AAU9D2P9_9LACO|nr:beta-glucoside-specific PTS transporter subunit IIABC [Xylocopilactobacillus apicola]BDR59076.1 PTS beta-glucoside transporter subunit EIIBCA [Xylocopilactobacillus apicola]
MSEKDLAARILEYVGGEQNVQALTHCVTRLRFNLKNDRLAQDQKIEALDDVMGVQKKGGQYQVIIGPKVTQVYKAIVSKVPRLNENSDLAPNTKKESLINRVINALSAILVPSLAPVIGGGMLKGFLYLLTTMKWVDSKSGTMFVLNISADAMFYFFPFLLAISSARFFKTNEYMAATLAGALLYPTLISAATAGKVAQVKFLGFIPIPMFNYSQSVIPIILAVWFLSYVYRFLEDHLPSMVTVIFTPLISLIVVVPITLFCLAPLGFYIGDYIAKALQVLINFSPLLAGAIIGGLRPVLVLTGMHHALRPLTIQQVATYGYSTLQAMNFMSTMAQASAALAIYLIVRNKKMKQISLSATISGFLGITEPALYGVLVKYKAAFAGACLGGALGGGIGAAMGAKAMAMVMPSVLSVPVFLNDKSAGFLIGVGVSIVSTIIITFLLSKTVFKLEEVPSSEKSQTDLTAIDVKSPVNGDVYLTEDVQDETFSKELMGKTVAIMPSDGVILAPVTGKVQMVFKTRHSIGLISDEGVEVMLHIGIDTVNLEGKYFESFVKEGDQVRVGQKLLEFDLAKIKESGYDPTVIVVITNSSNYLSVLSPADSEPIKAEESLIKIVENGENVR